MTNDLLTKEELYIVQDALIIYKNGYTHRPLSPSTKHRIKIIQKKILKMEELQND